MGRVLTVEGGKYDPRGPHDRLYGVLRYRFAIERTLRGDAAGEVRMVYNGADSHSVEFRRFGPLVVGERYLLSAGTGSATEPYPVHAGSGSILIKHDRHGARLIAEFAFLIPLTEEREQLIIAEATP